MLLLAKISATSLNSKACPRYFCYTNNNMPSFIQSSKYHARDYGTNYIDEAGPDSSNSTNFPSSHIQESTNGATSNNQTRRHSSKSNLRDYACSSKVLSLESYSFLQSSGLQHWFKNWQEQRKHKLTASTFGSAVGFWPRRRVQLWLEKIGLIEPFTGNLATCWSNIQEEVALERYKLITGNSVCFPEFQVYNSTNPQDDWLAASPDGVVEHFAYGLPCGGVLEVKCPFENGERNQQYWELLNLALSDFWWKHVQPAKELCRMDPVTDPFTLVEPLKPAPRHELCREIICASRLLVDESRLLAIENIHKDVFAEAGMKTKSWESNPYPSNGQACRRAALPWSRQALRPEELKASKVKELVLNEMSKRDEIFRK
ncbi:hypothetical protein ACLOJK_025057 [Asimina triloba]